MSDENETGKSLKKGLLKVDSLLDSGTYDFFTWIGGIFSAYSRFMERFSVEGITKQVVSLLSAGVTWGAAGSLLMLYLAIPTFYETETNWRSQEDYSVTFLDRYGNEIGKRGILANDSVPLSELPDHLIKATLATEDRRFFEHFGIDVMGLIRAMIVNAQAGGVVQGGSTITQQLAKNIFLTNEQTLIRKIKEAFLAVWLEWNLSKEEILKLYLDRAYMGGGSHGVVAASEFYFDKSVKDLTLAESAMLAGLYKAPTQLAPHVNLPKSRARANEVLYNMVQAGFLTEGQVVAARRNPATPIDRNEGYTPDWFLDWAFEEVKGLTLSQPGRFFTVRTTVDINLQKRSESVIQSMVRQHGPSKRVKQAGTVVLEPDGAVRAIVGGVDYGESQFNRATSALRQPGSSFKPFVYATAMEHGYTPESIVPDAPITIGNWSPRNYNRRYAGRINLTHALVKSINTVPVRLAQAIGRDKIVETAYNMGINSELKITRSLPLGAAEVTVIDMAGSYASFANGGYRAAPYGVIDIRDNRGQLIYDRRRDTKARTRVLSREAVRSMNTILSQVPIWGTARRAAIEGLQMAGKTGTTNAYVDAWFVGYTGNYTAAVWYGNDENTATNRLTGGNLPAMTWKEIMSYAHANIERKPLPYLEPPSAVSQRSNNLRVASAGTGLIPDRLAPQTTVFLEGLENLMQVRANGTPPEPSITQSIQTLSPLEQLQDDISRAHENGLPFPRRDAIKILPTLETEASLTPILPPSINDSAQEITPRDASVVIVDGQTNSEISNRTHYQNRSVGSNL